ncbi:MAG TPA: hypothetical protein VHW92_12945 [Mycobacteriales bacterium]|jgi:hypothetical protein|nr:hypothetical protein [Mycobacteriales bacterium]
MITFGAMTGLVLLMVVFGAVALRDVFRQTRAWSLQHPNPGVPLRQYTARFKVLTGPAGRWTALDDLQVTRLLREHR